MNDQTRPTNEPSSEYQRPDADETFTFDGDAAPPTNGHDAGHDGVRGTAENVMGQLRDAVDELTERAGPTVRDLAERAAPTVREISAKAAELTATAAVKAAPLVKRAGEVTADATTKLAEKSREWAADLRGAAEDATGALDDATDRPLPSDLAADVPIEPDTAPSFESTAESGTGGSSADEDRQADTTGI
jgi:hypothetical protein